MRSASADTDTDLTSRARIRDAAIALFGQSGYAGSSIRAIASEAGVSPALVIHHFGSKEGLREACDRYVTGVIRERKGEAMQGASVDPLAILRSMDDTLPLLRYVARAVVDSSPGVDRMVDTMVDDATAYMEEGVRAGYLKPTTRPRERAVLLSIWQLGALALNRHVLRLLDLDLLGEPAALLGWAEPAMEVLTHGIFADDRWQVAVEEAGKRGGLKR